MNHIKNNLHQTIWAFLFCILAVPYTTIAKSTPQNILQDHFYFIARQDSQLTTLTFTFTRVQNAKRPSKTQAAFHGNLSWKSHWFDLSTTNYPCPEWNSEIIPSNPIYDFEWPREDAPGKWSYHYDRVFLELDINPMRFVHQTPTKVHKGTKSTSKWFISNATLQGKKHRVEGVLLHHQLIIRNHKGQSQEELLAAYPTFYQKNRGKDTKGKTRRTHTAHIPFKTSKEKFFFVNSTHGESFIGWNYYPFFGPGPSPFLIHISPLGKVSSHQAEFNLLDLWSDEEELSANSNPLSRNWNVSLLEPNMLLRWQPTSHSLLQQGSRQYSILGTQQKNQSTRFISGWMLEKGLIQQHLEDLPHHSFHREQLLQSKIPSHSNY